MQIDFDGKGLETLLSQLQVAASEERIQQANEQIVQEGATRAKAIMQPKIPVSKDNSKSGRALKMGGESRPSGHARPNVPIGKTRDNGQCGKAAEVGWQLSDGSEYFYMKFVNWGTAKQPPRDFVDSTAEQVEPELQKIGERQYQKLLDETLGKAAE